MSERRALPMATIYDHPSDYPDHFVVRIIEVGPTGPGNMRSVGVHLADTLEGARRMVPSQFDYRLPRDPSDDPVIVETWI